MSLASYTDVFPLEFCAARFLRQWEKREEALFNSISTRPTDAPLIEALRYFQVARNFARLTKDPSSAKRIRETLLKVRSDNSLATPGDKVNALATSFQKDFGQFNLSAATKLLWLSFRAPYVVYDKRAVTALSKHAGHRAVAKSYTNFSDAWRAEFGKFDRAIATAILNLPSGRAFMPKTQFTDTELKALAAQVWFKERVFDIFLWEIGGNR